MEEKHNTSTDGHDRQDSHSDGDGQNLTWTDEEERVLVKKVDMIIMPMLILGFFALQLDRGNIGNALTDYFLRDVGITQNQFNVGQQLLSVGIVLLEIPSNIILYRVGPPLWIGGQIVAWGLVATLQAFQKGLASFLVTRILLGLLEAGFIPAGLYTMTRWYKKDETGKRFSFYFIGNMFAVACTGIIAYGILHMRGIAGLAGWQWLFILEGIFTVLVGIAFLLLFPRQPSNPVSYFGVRYFTERESQILQQRVLRDDSSKAHPHQSVSKQELKAAPKLTNWRLIPHVIFTIAGIAPSSTMGSYAPTLVASYGFGRLKANAMVSIGSWILLFVNLLWGWAADRFQIRGPLVVLGIFLFWAFTLGQRLLVESSNSNLRFAMLTLSIAFSLPWHPINGSWLSLNAQSAGERSITMAILIMAANCSGIIGKQLFREEDAPLYRTGWSVILGLASVALFFAVVANLQYYLLNGRKFARKGLRYYY